MSAEIAAAVAALPASGGWIGFYGGRPGARRRAGDGGATMTPDELLESIEDQAERGVAGWTLPSGQNALVQAPGGHLSVVHTSLLRRWAEALREHLAPSPGDMINARARAGARLADEEALLAKIPRGATLVREMAAARVGKARAEYENAKAAERAMAGRRA